MIYSKPICVVERTRSVEERSFYKCTRCNESIYGLESAARQHVKRAHEGFAFKAIKAQPASVDSPAQQSAATTISQGGCEEAARAEPAVQLQQPHDEEEVRN